MNIWHSVLVSMAVALTSFSWQANAGSSAPVSDDASSQACVGYGPQTPRDIDSKAGNNARIFSMAPDPAQMNLCNIHFHQNAEHKAKDFSIFAGKGDKAGYQCAISKTLNSSELAPVSGDVCNGLTPGDTIEVHWVHTSCDIEPGAGLGSCLSDKCANPDLRVETQVFTLVNDSDALNFADFAYDGNVVDGYHQAKALPGGTGEPVEFLGSTTGPSYSEAVCSPLQVGWSVRPSCAKLDINSLGKWCEANVFGEDHAHGVRKLVVNPDLLSEIE